MPKCKRQTDRHTTDNAKKKRVEEIGTKKAKNTLEGR